jgi:hypothetical protein
MSQDLSAYNLGLAQYLLGGIAACYRGNRLYDTPEVQAVVTHWVAVYKKHRRIITSDIVQLRRTDGQGLDAFLHVNPFIPEQGFAAVFNPTNTYVNQSITFKLYYTGITTQASFSQEDGPAVVYPLERDYSVTLMLEMPPESATWFVITDASASK